MIPNSITFEDLARVLQVPPERLARLCRISGLHPKEGSITPLDLLVSALANAVAEAVPALSDEGVLGLLLRELRPHVRGLADLLEEVWQKWGEDPEVPSFHLGIAENQFVTWKNLDNFYHPATGTFVERLPTPAAWATTIHPAAIYFRARNVLKEVEDARSSAGDTEQASG